MGAVDGAVLCDNGTRLKAGVGAGRNETLNSYDRERTSWVWLPGASKKRRDYVPELQNSGDHELNVLRMRTAHWGTIQEQGQRSGEHLDQSQVWDFS